MHKLSSRQWLVLVLLTIVWGINWPIMKAGVTGFPPLTFRMLCLWLGTPVLGLALLAMRVPFRIPREHWRELLVLAVFNMFIWHGMIIIAVQSLSSGRSAILGYTMPIFSAVLGALFFGHRLPPRAWAGVGAAALGVMLLLWPGHTAAALTAENDALLRDGGQALFLAFCGGEAAGFAHCALLFAPSCVSANGFSNCMPILRPSVLGGLGVVLHVDAEWDHAALVRAWCEELGVLDHVR